MNFFDRVKPGDYVVTPFSDRPGITSDKKYKIINVLETEHLFEFYNDHNQLVQHDSNIFFEADTYWTCTLMRTFSLLMHTRLTLLLPK